MKILCTGGSGFIGTYVCEELEEQGYEPVVLDRQARPNPRYETILGDVRDAAGIMDAVAHVEGVIHLAGVLGTQETVEDPRPAAETNVMGSLNVFQAVARYDLPAVYIAVGNHWMGNPYSITKTCAERMAFMFNAERGTRIAVVRALNAYGPRQVPAPPYGPSKVRKIMPAFICRALAGQPIEIYGDGQQVMDMIYVADVARVLVAALETDNYLTPFEAGTGRRTTVTDIARAVLNEVTEVKGSITYLPMRPGEEPGSVVVGNPDTLKPLGIEDLTTLEQGVKLTVESFR